MAVKKLLFLILVHSCITHPNLNGCVCVVLRHFNTAAIIHATLLCKAQDVDYCYRCLVIGTTVSCAKMAELIKMPLGSRYTQGHGEGAHYFTTFLKGDFILS